jgi:uncharacterized protein YdaU (DUF1376 family)
MPDEDEIEEKEIDEEIAELMKGQGMNEEDAGAASEAPEEAGEEEEKTEEADDDSV